MNTKRTLALLTLFVAVVARGDEPKWSTKEPVSQSASRVAAKDLRKVADDPNAKRADREAAVFALFANYMKPPCGSTVAAKALGDANWLTVASIEPVLFPFHLPVEFESNATVYSLHLFPIKDELNHSSIYLRLTGGPNQSADDLRAFLRGGKGLKDKREIVKFALCYTGDPKPKGPERVELFEPDGLTIMSDKD